MTPEESLVRWRLVLGSDAEQGLGCGLGGAEAGRDRALGFLYDREYGPGRNVRGPKQSQGGSPQKGAERSAGLEDSAMSVPDWINEVHQLFPKRTIERIEKDALERYQL